MDWKELEKRFDALADQNKTLKEQLALHMAKGSDYRNHNENTVLKSFGANHLSDIIHTNIACYDGVTPAHKYAIMQLKKDLQCARLEAQLKFGDPLDAEFDREVAVGHKCPNILNTNYAKVRNLEARLKAFGTENVGEGAEWVQTLIGTSYIEEFELEYNLHKMFMQVGMPVKVYDAPKQSGRGVARGIAENAVATEGTFGTDTIQLSAKKLVEYYPISEEIAEGDSAANLVQLARDEVVKAQLRAYDEMIISGQIASALDADVTTADDARRQQDGLRTRAIANSANGVVVDFANSSVADAGLKTMRAVMGKYGVHPMNLMLIPSPAVYISMIDLDSVKTMDAIGNDFTMRKGVLDYWLGAAIQNSEAMRDDLSDAGVYDGVTTDRGSILMVKKDEWLFGTRRPIRVRAAVDPRPEYDRRQVVSYSRVAFNGHEQDANRKTVTYGINIKVT